jgi:hypothetical protein
VDGALPVTLAMRGIGKSNVVARKDHKFRLVLDQGIIGIVAARVRGEIFHGGEQAAQVERMLPATRPTLPWSGPPCR